MSRLKAPANLPDLVKTTFTKALSANELHYFPTQVTLLPVNSIPFQLRFSPSLANKPKGPEPAASPSSSQPRKPFDPFANPPPALFIADLGSSHFLVLNKFAVVPEHFILATKEYKLQTHVLEQVDLEAALACIHAYEEARKLLPRDPGPGANTERKSEQDGLFVFFNGGDNSGASQPHRHLQLLPVSRMKDGLAPDSTWDVLAQRIEVLKKTPFLVFSEQISTATSSDDLYAAYLRLYNRACRAVAQHAGAPTTEHVPSTGEAHISYNMAMTKDSLVICPRLSEGSKIENIDGSKVVGSLALNGTVLAGTALVKNEAEWDALTKNPEQLHRVLKAIGVPRDGSNEDSNKL